MPTEPFSCQFGQLASQGNGERSTMLRGSRLLTHTEVGRTTKIIAVLCLPEVDVLDFGAVGDTARDIDIQRIVDEVRERVRVHRNLIGQLAPSLPSLPSDGRLAREVAALSAHWNVYEAPVVTTRRVFGRPVAVLKRALRRLLAPALGQQVAFNAAVVSTLTQVAEHLEIVARQGDVIEDTLLRQAKTAAELNGAHGALAKQATDMQELHAVTSEIQTALRTLRAEITTAVAAANSVASQEERLAQPLRERLARVERTLRRIKHAADGEHVQANLQSESDFDNVSFDERFRGSEETIHQRQRAYVECFAGRDRVADLGCGRGEFLELLRSAGVRAIGVDSDLDMILACREKGFDVTQEDAFAFLARQPDHSLGGVFSAQMIEHLPPERVIALVALAQRKLAPGAPLVLETPNPSCLSVFAASFYIDFTHQRPIHPEAMRFLLETNGFENVRLVFSSPVQGDVLLPHIPGGVGNPEFEARFNRAIDHLNSLLYGCQDYAVIGTRAAARSASTVA